MTLTQMEYVIALNEHRHFKKAAEACFITQPTLSMQIAKLEEELGIILFDRSKSPILPTLMGEKIIFQMEKAIQEIKGISALIKSTQKNIEGPITLGIIPTLAPYLLPLFLDNFVKSYPKVELEIRELQTAEIILQLEKDNLDAALLITPLGVDNIIERHLFYEEMAVYANKDHPLAKKRRIHEKDLSGKGLWPLKEGHCFREQTLNLCNSAPRPWPKFASGSLETLFNLVEYAGGHTLIPQLAAKKRQKTSKAVIIPFAGVTPVREVSLVHFRPFHKEGHLDALEKIILKSLPKELKSLKKKTAIIPIS